MGLFLGRQCVGVLDWFRRCVGMPNSISTTTHINRDGVHSGFDLDMWRQNYCTNSHKTCIIILNVMVAKYLS